MESTSQEPLLLLLEFGLIWVESMGFILLGMYFGILWMAPEIAPAWVRSLFWFAHSLRSKAPLRPPVLHSAGPPERAEATGSDAEKG